MKVSKVLKSSACNAVLLVVMVLRAPMVLMVLLVPKARMLSGDSEVIHDGFEGSKG